MKILCVLALSCATLLSETKVESDLRKQLAATKAALAAEEAHSRSLQAGQKKLTDAVVVQTETSKKNSDKIEAATDKIIESAVTGKKLVETVRSQVVATQNATAQLANEVKTQNAAVTYAITSQTKQQEKALLAARAAAREVARKLAESNAELAESKRQDAVRMGDMQKTLQDIIRRDEITEAKNKATIIREALPVAATIVGSMCGLGVTIAGIFQIKALYQAKAQLAVIAKQQSETHTMVNGQREANLKEIEQLKAELAATRQTP
jgi:hypothetical protein